MHDLRTALQNIETALDASTYQPGAWSAFVRTALQQPLAMRRALAHDVSRISNKLHRRQPRYTMSFSGAVLIECVVAGSGVVLLRSGINQQSGAMVCTAATVLAFTLQPLIKIGVGTLLGVRYSYMYIQGAEPRFKMQYGSYLVAPRWKRILLHLSGTVGATLAYILVSSLTAKKMPKVAAGNAVLAAIVASLQITPFVAGLVGARQPALLVKLVHESSAGHAANELRSIITAWRRPSHAS